MNNYILFKIIDIYIIKMGFNTKKNRNSFIPVGKNYQKLRSIEDLSSLIDKDTRYSLGSEFKMPTSTYNKRFSEQSFNSISNVSVAETECSTTTVESNDINDIYDYYQSNYNNTNETSNKPKKHRKRKTLSKIFQRSFSINGQLQQSMQCPDWEYYCNNNYNAY